MDVISSDAFNYHCTCVTRCLYYYNFTYTHASATVHTSCVWAKWKKFQSRRRLIDRVLMCQRQTGRAVYRRYVNPELALWKSWKSVGAIKDGALSLDLFISTRRKTLACDLRIIKMRGVCTFLFREQHDDLGGGFGAKFLLRLEARYN